MKIVCIGDSITYGYAVKNKESWVKILSKKFDAEVINCGVNGDTTEGMCSRFEKYVIKELPDYCIIMGGTNDVLTNMDIKKSIKNINSMVCRAEEKEIKTFILTPIPIIPRLARRYWMKGIDYDNCNVKLQEYRGELLEKFEGKVIDLYEVFSKLVNMGDEIEYYVDGIHPNSLGHIIICDNICEELKIY